MHSYSPPYTLTSAILKKVADICEWNALFANLPVESMVYANQQGYYNAINVGGGDNGCTPFIEFMLDVITETLAKLKSY